MHHRSSSRSPRLAVVALLRRWLPTLACALAACTLAVAAAAAAASGSTGPQAATAAWPASTRLQYRLHGSYLVPLQGSGALEWQRDGAHYRLRLSGSAWVSVSYTSSGTIDGSWLAPQAYAEQVMLKRKTVRFDRSAGLLRFSATSATAPIAPHMQDSASVFMQLAQWLRSRPQDFVAGRRLHLQVARPSGTTTWDFRVVGLQPLDTGAGPLRCWHLAYDPPAHADLGAQVWLAPALHGLPVQILLRHSADEYLEFSLAGPPQPLSKPAPAP